MSMQCTCFRAWAATQVSCFPFPFCFAFLFLFSFFFFWFISLPISIFLLLNFLTNIADSFGFKISKTHKKFHFARLASNSTTQSSLYLWVLLPAARRDLCCVECIHLIYLPFSIISLNDGEIVKRAYRSSPQQQSGRMQRDVSGPVGCGDVKTGELARGAAVSSRTRPISPTSRPWVHHLIHRRVGESNFYQCDLLIEVEYPWFSSADTRSSEWIILYSPSLPPPSLSPSLPPPPPSFPLLLFIL